ncbi:ubiquitin-protein ligase E3B-like [Argopecten irradians]|uniref:ubiquitin-protein ligase E3B-like n=1 Tax=Argopecten irradians TaxID=31199 RepID=UPI00371658B6
MFNKVGHSTKNQFLEQTKAARAERAQEKERDKNAIILQAHIRGFLTRRRFQKGLNTSVNDLLQIPENPEDEYKPKLLPALEAYRKIKQFFFIYSRENDKKKFEYLCRYLLSSMDTEQIKLCYVSVALMKPYVVEWIQQTKNIMWHSCSCLRTLRPENHTEMQSIMLHLRMLITFTSTSTWKILRGKSGEPLASMMNQLCNNLMGNLNTKGMYPILQGLLTRGLAASKPAFKHASLSAVITLALRPLIASNFSENLMNVFILHILSVPAIVCHMSTMSPACLTQMVTHRIFKRSLDLLTNEQSTRIIFNSLEGNYALCLLANLVQLGYMELEGLVENTLSFMTVVIRLLESCKVYVQNKKSNLTHWHPVLGWFSQNTDQCLHAAMPYVVKQLQLLWCEKMIRLLFQELITYKEADTEKQSSKSSTPSKNIVLRVLDKASSKPSVKIKLESSIATSTCLPCALYQTTINTLSQLRLDILGGLSYNDVLLPILWKFLCDMGPNCGLKTFVELLSQAPNSTIHPVFSLLTVFCESASHYITTLDDIEMYEQQKIFHPSDYMKMSEFLNLFVFRLIWHNLIDVQTANVNDMFGAARGLLMILYERDCRKSYTEKDHWLIRDIKPSLFITELEKGRKTAVGCILQKVPHIIPFSERVKIFRRNVTKEKEVMGLTESACASPQSTLITINRGRVVEDGYRQLAQLPARSMKGVIRVKFINEQGLDEAGIDQDGVFKEFLEETITKVFDPSLNLFKVTSEQKLYPSSTSHIQENHLTLFEFVGKMLAKAVYEGIVVEVPFAPFFLTQILGHQQSATYSSLDELPSLDPELAKSLCYTKHYDGDISDLELTFSCDEDCMGRIETHELVPGGKAISVTNENKIRYVHLMAHFRMYRQIKEQSMAFIRGFKTVINSDWLKMFSAPELQKLISGDNADLDIGDLRRHTQYYGGYHNNHKVINWLWEVLDKDFSSSEKGLFLKFVTSCSKPPLLGFAHLEPPFSVRCVEVSDDQDTGDTVGSVLKGFFNIKRRDPVGRLPTSSTCFNLLKLPNYQKRSTLKEKLRYAINSNTGFELS